MKNIDTIEKWNILAAALKDKGYRLWQMQFSYDVEEGFHAWFWRTDHEDVEVATHDKKVQDAIIGYKK